jgi:hypothetical protein
MNSQLDTALQAAAAAEATYNADVSNVGNIQSAIAAATAPLAPAQAQLGTDAAAFNTTLDGLSAAALAAKVPIPN